MDVAKFIGIIVALGALVLLGIRILIPAANRAAEQKKAWLAFLLITLQFIIFLAAFTLMIFFAMAVFVKFQQG